MFTGTLIYLCCCRGIHSGACFNAWVFLLQVCRTASWRRRWKSRRRCRKSWGPGLWNHGDAGRPSRPSPPVAACLPAPGTCLHVCLSACTRSVSLVGRLAPDTRLVWRPVCLHQVSVCLSSYMSVCVPQGLSVCPCLFVFLFLHWCNTAALWTLCHVALRE